MNHTKISRRAQWYVGIVTEEVVIKQCALKNCLQTVSGLQMGSGHKESGPSFFLYYDVHG